MQAACYCVTLQGLLGVRCIRSMLKDMNATWNRQQKPEMNVHPLQPCMCTRRVECKRLKWCIHELLFITLTAQVHV